MISASIMLLYTDLIIINDILYAIAAFIVYFLITLFGIYTKENLYKFFNQMFKSLNINVITDLAPVNYLKNRIDMANEII